MFSMQYLVSLPAAFDLHAIKARVQEKAPDYDAFPGLALKVWMTQSSERHGCNLYGSFYLWSDASGAAEFLTGAGYQGIIDSFGRRPVASWIALRTRITGPLDRAMSAVQSFVDVPESGSVAMSLDTALERHADLAPSFTAVCLDPTLWRLVAFSLLAKDASDVTETLGPDARTFDVQHVSLPQGIDGLSLQRVHAT